MKLIICSNCKETKPYYAKNLCKKCYRRKYHLEHLEEARLYDLKRDKRRRLKLKLEIFNHYSNGKISCDCCGDSHIEFLTIDHINGDGAEHKREIGMPGAGGNRFYYWLKRNNYPEGFRVLCMNCNCSRGQHGYCPHEKEVQQIL